MTNFFINLGFSCLGLYYELVLIPRSHHHDHYPSSSFQQPQPPPPGIPVETTIVGYTELVYISAGQMGYQLWSIPMGICIIHESIPMLVHHMTVIVCASMSCFLHYGFRYYTPFFYGIVEISSIALAIMNIFKDHPTTLQYYYPKTNTNIRYLFAALFLYIRIVLFLPRKYNFLRDHLLLWTSIHPRYHADTTPNHTNDNTIGGTNTVLFSPEDTTTIAMKH